MTNWQEGIHNIGVDIIDYEHQELKDKLINFINNIYCAETKEEIYTTFDKLYKHFTYHLHIDTYLHKEQKPIMLKIREKFNQIIIFKLNNIKNELIMSGSDDYIKNNLKIMLKELFLEHIIYDQLLMS